MAHRLFCTAMLMTVTAAPLAACGDGGKSQAQSTGRATVAGAAYTSDQLRQALLTPPAGYKHMGEPDAGEYGALKSVQNFDQLQRQVKIDKPRCRGTAGASPGGPALDKSAPAAIAAFGKGREQTVTETLIAMSGDAAEKHVRARVPEECATFKTKVGDKWSEHRVAEAQHGALGEGSRTVGITTRTGDTRIKSWYVVLRGNRYLATISMFGPKATRAEAERLAQQAGAHAEKILP